MGWNPSCFFGLVAVKTARNNVLRSFCITGYDKSTDGAFGLCSTSVMTSLWDALRSWVMFTCGHWFFPFLMWRMILSSGPLLSMELNGINFFSPFVLFVFSFFTFVAIHVFVLPFYLIAPLSFVALCDLEEVDCFQWGQKSPRLNGNYRVYVGVKVLIEGINLGGRTQGSWIPSVWPQLNTRSPIKRDAPDRSIKPLLSPRLPPSYWQGQLIHR